MEAESAESSANYFLTSEVNPEAIFSAHQNGEISDETSSWFERMCAHYLRNDLVLRTCLLDSARFKAECVPPHLKPYYEPLKLWEKVWVTEISIPELFCQRRLRLGEILIDPTATAPFASMTPSYLAVHVPGFIKIREAETENVQEKYIRNDEPYTHIIRTQQSISS